MADLYGKCLWMVDSGKAPDLKVGWDVRSDVYGTYVSGAPSLFCVRDSCGDSVNPCYRHDTHCFYGACVRGCLQKNHSSGKRDCAINQ